MVHFLQFCQDEIFLVFGNFNTPLHYFLGIIISFELHNNAKSKNGSYFSFHFRETNQNPDKSNSSHSFPS
jgi:hypothetical protein